MGWQLYFLFELPTFLERTRDHRISHISHGDSSEGRQSAVGNVIGELSRYVGIVQKGVGQFSSVRVSIQMFECLAVFIGD
jgi:hypothetical protein